MIEQLEAELARLGVDARARRRIVIEFRDHLRCEPGAQMGDPHALAQEFADDLGTHRTRLYTVLGFLGLAFAGLVYAAALLFIGASAATSAPGVPGPGTTNSIVAVAMGVLLVLAPQVAFVSGILAILRVVRHRDLRSVPAAELRLVLRRSVVAVGMGMVTMAALAVLAVLPADGGLLQGGNDAHVAAQPALILALSLAALALLACALTLLLRTFPLRTSQPGDGGWLGDDIAGLLPFSRGLGAWQFAFATAAIAGAAVWIAGVLASDPIDGALRGVAEACACLAGFVVFRGMLGLRPPVSTQET